MAGLNRVFNPRNLNIHDGEWIFSILLVGLIMMFNDAAWNVVGLALIYILLAFHSLTQHKNLYRNNDIWPKRLILLGSWVGSFFFIAIMPVVVMVQYAGYARDIKRKFSAKEYKIAWTAYMRILGVTAFAAVVYLLKMYGTSAVVQ
ncbi:MAG TPA: hypothetical protein PLO23_01320 [Alphaproteobacteria bacterium]|nr:hypothetical protein [Alphaproteobacteria bacterium]